MSELRATPSEPEEAVLGRGAEALGVKMPSLVYRDLAAPAMPAGFYGRVVFEYQGGRLVMTTIETRVKPGA